MQPGFIIATVKRVIIWRFIKYHNNRNAEYSRRRRLYSMPKYSMKFMILKDISALSKDRAALSRKDVFQAFFLWFGVLLRALTQEKSTLRRAFFSYIHLRRVLLRCAKLEGQIHLRNSPVFSESFFLYKRIRKNDSMINRFFRTRSCRPWSCRQTAALRP